MKTKYKYIQFIKMGVREREGTSWWHIMNIKHDQFLGSVQYYSKWKRYCFHPIEHSLYSAECLADIIDFINQLERKKE